MTTIEDEAIDEDPDEFDPVLAELDETAQGELFPGLAEVRARLKASLEAIDSLAYVGTELRNAIIAKERAEETLYRAALAAHDAGLTWPDVRKAIGGPDDTRLPSTNQLYERSKAYRKDQAQIDNEPF